MEVRAFAAINHGESVLGKVRLRMLGHFLKFIAEAEMKKLAGLLFALLIFSAPTFAQDKPAATYEPQRRPHSGARPGAGVGIACGAGAHYAGGQEGTSGCAARSCEWQVDRARYRSE